MSFIDNLLIAFALAMDAVAISLALGFQLQTIRIVQCLYICSYFGLFQFLMPLIGYFSSTLVYSKFEQYGHWIAFVLLVFIGLNMIYEAFKIKNPENRKISFLPLLGLAIATSLDAFSVGISFKFIELPIFVPAIIIGIVCMICTATALWLGTVLSGKNTLGQKAELLGGIVLIGIAIQILVSRL